MHNYLEYNFLKELSKYYHQYKESKDHSEKNDLLGRFLFNFKNSVYLKPTVWKLAITWKAHKHVTLDQAFSDFKEKVFTENNLIEDKFKELFNSILKEYINYDISDNIVNDAKKMIVNDMNAISSEYERVCSQNFDIYLSSISGIRFFLDKSSLTFISGKTESAAIYDPSNLFKESKNEKSLSLLQIIVFNEKICFALLSNNINKTYIIRFSITQNSKDDYEISEYDDQDLFIAWGSNANKYILFEKTNKKAFSASLIEGKRFSKKGQVINIFSSIGKVKTAAYTQKSRKLYLISDEGFLYYKEMIGEEIDVVLVKRRREDSHTELSQHAPLLSSNGTVFQELDISEDETTLFLSSYELIECFNCNFELLLKIEAPELISFKTLNFEQSICMVILKKNMKFACKKIVIPREERQINVKSNIKINIPGNPIFDIWHHGITKFGSQNEITQIIKGSRKIGYYMLKEKSAKIEAYFKNLKKVNESYKFIGFAEPKLKLFKKGEVKKDTFLYALWTRIPLHLASIQQNNLIPLQNGKNSFDEFSNNSKNEDFMEEFVNYIKLGHFEEILERLNNIIIFSIIGRQSSGKSYLLNRLTGSRFDVAAERCTDGIWVALTKIENKDIIIFDCEGLFTIERSTQEEVKLCLFLTSLSDILILNGDLSSAKHIKDLFDEFSRGVGRLKGKDLFKAILDITYRDIPDNQADGASKEFWSFVENLVSTGRGDTLEKLFKTSIWNSQYHNFENSLFEEEVEEIRTKYMEIEPRWKSGIELKETIKIVLFQIFSDDNMSLDYRSFYSKLNKLKKLFLEMLSSPEIALKHISVVPIEEIFEIETTTIKIELDLINYAYNEEQPLSYFLDKIIPYTELNQYRDYRHNQFYTELNRFIQSFFEKRKAVLLNFIKGHLPNINEFREIIGEGLLNQEILFYEQQISIISTTNLICLRKCLNCNNFCILLNGHKDKECNCGTDHICVEQCIFCDAVRCSLPCGHERNHICDRPDHSCPNACVIKNCGKKCAYYPGHEEECICSGSHPCNKNCEMYDLCGETCRRQITEEHETHDCNISRCPCMCLFKDGNNCKSTDHFHDKICEKIPHPHTNEYIKFHICGKKHKCVNNCSSEGICETRVERTNKLFKNEYNEFYYTYIELIVVQKPCKHILETGMVYHENIHICNSKMHLCPARCPDCNALCSLWVGHSGFHQSDTHRNKDNSIFISIDKAFEHEHEDFRDIKVNKSTFRFNAGESASPEMCDESCSRRSRGHSHPVRCKGGSFCLQLIDKDHVKHSKIPYYSSKEGENHYYDLVDCDTYWKMSNWLPPIQSKDPALQESFGKCNFFCNHPSHAVKVYCVDHIFHSESIKYCDHNFPCKGTHDSSADYDIVFVLDCTVSMNQYYGEVIEMIKSLINRWGENINKFAVVTYTDHGSASGKYDPDRPVKTFPSSRKLSDANGRQAIQYIERLKTSGGGGNYGEALIDGLDEANTLYYRKDSKRICVLICDEPPHGRDFSKDTCYPEGCPCNLSWRSILTNMKNSNTDFIFIRLDQRLNVTRYKFEEIYKDGLISVDLQDAKNFNLKVTNLISQIIETNFEYCDKSRMIPSS